MVHGIDQETKDRGFIHWIRENKHRLELLEDEGFTPEQAMDMLKIWSIQLYEEAAYNF